MAPTATSSIEVGVTVTDAKGKTTYTNALLTSLDVTRNTVAEIVACARARWKIEYESFNVLKSNRYHLEHTSATASRTWP